MAKNNRLIKLTITEADSWFIEKALTEMIHKYLMESGLNTQSLTLDGRNPSEELLAIYKATREKVVEARNNRRFVR